MPVEGGVDEWARDAEEAIEYAKERRRGWRG